MARRGVEFTILCEDVQQQVFIRKFLRRHPDWTAYRRIRLLPLPSGEGAGEQYVREQYPIEVEALRTSHHARALMVMVDADLLAVEERYQQLAVALEAHSPGRPRCPEEPIALLVPKRTVETWIYYLLEKDQGTETVVVDETRRYPKYERESDCHPATELLHSLITQGTVPPADCPASLKLGFDELSRIL